MSRNKPKANVKTSKGRKGSSTLWLRRQLNDPYVAEAQRLGYRGRAAFKLKEMDEKLKILKPGMRVVDLGAAPGGWCQIATEKGCSVFAIDLLEMDEMADMDAIQMDFMDNDAPDRLKAMLGGHKADIVLSDMAPNTIGHKQTDHLRIMALVEAAYLFATEVLEPDGIFIAKVFQGGAQNNLLAEMKRDFKTTKHIKPAASRKESSETYLIASGFKG
jgi:23S rRNA (uridine2552-2'-O)-methyltransferase